VIQHVDAHRGLIRLELDPKLFLQRLLEGRARVFKWRLGAGRRRTGREWQAVFGNPFEGEIESSRQAGFVYHRPPEICAGAQGIGDELFPGVGRASSAQLQDQRSIETCLAEDACFRPRKKSGCANVPTTEEVQAMSHVRFSLLLLCRPSSSPVPFQLRRSYRV
jgi:hypothetical protein